VVVVVVVVAAREGQLVRGRRLLVLKRQLLQGELLLLQAMELPSLLVEAP
jgi:hypothetical protein